MKKVFVFFVVFCGLFSHIANATCLGCQSYHWKGVVGYSEASNKYFCISTGACMDLEYYSGNLLTGKPDVVDGEPTGDFSLDATTTTEMMVLTSYDEEEVGTSIDISHFDQVVVSGIPYFNYGINISIQPKNRYVKYYESCYSCFGTFCCAA